MACHQLGSKGTREIPDAYAPVRPSVAAWERRVQSGQAGAQMLSAIDKLGKSAHANDVRRLDRSHRRR